MADQFWLRWRGDLAESAEVRRAYSGLYGRFVARALLSHHLGLKRFVSLRRNDTQVSPSIVVSRIGKGDIPDWIAWDDRRSSFALCEAKGSLTSTDFLAAGGPKCVHEGKSQFGRVETRDGSRILHPDEWVAATRWSTDTRHVYPVTVLWDPPNDDDVPSSDDAERRRRAITRAWLDSIAPGLGSRDADDLLSGERRHSAVVIHAKPGPIPAEEDWPLLEEDSDLLPDDLLSQSGTPQIASLQERRVDETTRDALQGNLSESAVYHDHSLLKPADHEKHTHQGVYLAAVVTRFGIRPVRSRTEFETIEREQDSAFRQVEPAMLIGLPFNYDWNLRPDNSLWLDGAGIAPGGDLALFDLRRVTVEPLEP